MMIKTGFKAARYFLLMVVALKIPHLFLDEMKVAGKFIFHARVQRENKTINGARTLTDTTIDSLQQSSISVFDMTINSCVIKPSQYRRHTHLENRTHRDSWKAVLLAEHCNI